MTARAFYALALCRAGAHIATFSPPPLVHVRTYMSYMFWVRSARALAPKALSRATPRARCLRRCHPTSPRLPGRTSPRIACRHFDSAGREGVQPEQLNVDTSKVTTMQHSSWCASRVPWPPQSLESGHPACTLLASLPPPTPSRLPGRPAAAPHPASHARLSTRQEAQAFDEPRSASTRPRSRPWTSCSWCAPRVPWPPHKP